jgi:Enoyl-CoA hydratase/isomerase
LGLLPGGGGTQRLPRLVGKGRALQLILTGETITAQEAYRIGLVNEIVPAASLIERAEAILKQIAANAPIAVKFRWRLRTRGWKPAKARALPLKPPTSAFAPLPKTRRRAPPPFSRSVHRSFTDTESSARETGNLLWQRLLPPQFRQSASG